ncbi:MAG: SUMF1/EgtB/PvdO family nonheme iron enzyme [Caldilineaceae bacterium]
MRDMAGNVAEWTLSDGQEGMAIVMGGSFVDDAAWAVQSGARQLAAPDATESWLGFRCVTVPFLW